MRAPTNLTQPDLDAIVAWNLVRAARRSERVMTDGLIGHALTPVQFGVLAQLAVDGALTPAALARELGVRPYSAATLVEGLQERGLVHRARAPRGRGRPRPVQLTAQGTALLEVVWGLVMATNDIVEVPAAHRGGPPAG